jgi:ATP-dependent Lon protease
MNLKLKKDFENSLNELIIIQNQKHAEEIFAKQIGFSKEKKLFLNHISFYAIFKGNFRPDGDIICYSGAPGTGKTTFVKTAAEAMGRPLIIISCAGLGKDSKFSILGDHDKPSLIAQVVVDSGCRNPIVLFDELEKADQKIQPQLLEILKKYKKGESYEDPFFKKEINLSHMTFFATVNYKKKLSTKFKDSVFMKELSDYTDEEKIKILSLKRKEIQEKYKLTEDEIKKILPGGALGLIVKKLKEKGIRKSEQALNKITEEYIYAKQTGERFEEEK